MDYEDCVFCQIITKKMTSDILYQDNELIAFHDINPQAPSHILIVPKKHISCLSQIETEDTHLLGKMLTLAKDIAILAPRPFPPPDIKDVLLFKLIMAYNYVDGVLL